ncbi:hypothetical protein TSUD_347560 [Trifolium subterraneum]|nr:hypothetical protein TSUD_347560 [Trifolium subterraneum]
MSLVRPLFSLRDCLWSFPKLFMHFRNSRFDGDNSINIDIQMNFLTDLMQAPRVTEADKNNDRRSLQRALDRRLYLLLYGDAYGAPSGKLVWHFPEKLYESEETMCKCAESALKSVIGDLSNTYFVGNTLMAHMVVQPNEDHSVSTSLRIGYGSQPYALDRSMFFSLYPVSVSIALKEYDNDNWLWIPTLWTRSIYVLLPISGLCFYCLKRVRQ